MSNNNDHVSATMREYLPLLDGMVNPSVLPEDELRLSNHCKIIYRRLLKGKATNVELAELTKSMNPTARRTDLRQELQKHGWDLKRIENLGGGVNVYALVDQDGNIQTGEQTHEDCKTFNQ